jgi:hypothetical protein
MLQFDHTEEGVQTELILNGRHKFVLTWANTTVFTHLAKWQQVDHIYVVTRPTNAVSTMGIYIFRDMVPGFNENVQLLEFEDYPRTFKPVPVDQDFDAFTKYASKDLEHISSIADIPIIGE